MNRVIKFRAWDKNKKVFIPTNTWAVCTLYDNTKALAVMIEDWEDYCVGEYMYDYAQEVMQFTGLHDKNGKEIYEGDILEHNGKVQKVVFYNTNNGAYYCQFNTGGGFVDNIMYFIQRDCEVIGNIYENPELLKL